MSELIAPNVNLEFSQISNGGTRLSAEAQEFHRFLKAYVLGSRIVRDLCRVFWKFESVVPSPTS
jgi:hypothetical protein